MAGAARTWLDGDSRSDPRAVAARQDRGAGKDNDGKEGEGRSPLSLYIDNKLAAKASITDGEADKLRRAQGVRVAPSTGAGGRL